MSFVDFFRPIFKYIPEVSKPSEKPALNARLKWTLLIIVLFTFLGQIKLFGLAGSTAGDLSSAQIILASSIGTLLTVGIGPIVVASIILQLLVGSGIISLDFSTPQGRKDFSSLQKLFSIILSFVEAYVYTQFGFLTALPGYFLLIVLQVAIGSIILLYFDEIIKNYGIGSGISLFIASGVATSAIWTIFSPVSVIGTGLNLFTSGAHFSLATGSGYLWAFISQVGMNFYNAFVVNIIPIFSALLIFAVVVYFQGVHINIPLTMGTAGKFGRYPVKFLYVSNMPVILAVALFTNIYIMSLLFSKVPILGSIMVFLAKYTTAPNALIEQVLLQGDIIALMPMIIQGVVYTILLMITCVLFGVIWVQIAGQDSAAVAKQLQSSGMFLPGFRRDPRVIKGVLDKYIPIITILGALFVGFLAGFASLANAVGTGMGILLTVDIVYRFYEEIVKEQVSDSTFLSKFLTMAKK